MTKIPGIVACRVLSDQERDIALELETKTNTRNQLLGMRILNEGITAVLNRKYVVLIAHSNDLRHPPGPIVVIRDENSVVGEEVWQPDHISNLSHDPNAILLGKSLVLYRDALARARGRQLILSYKALPFPELEEVENISDVVSVTVGTLTHIRLSQNAGWNYNDPNLGTVLVGFNDRTQYS